MEGGAESVAFVTDEECDDLISNVSINDAPLRFAQKSKVRRVLYGARLMAGGGEQPEAGEGGPDKAVHADDGAKPASAACHDPKQTVHVGDGRLANKQVLS